MVTNKAFAKRVEVATLFQGSRKQHNGSWRDDLAHVSGVASVNAYYNQASNAVVVPISALQPPLFWNRPKALTFGAFGIVVGEFRHNFSFAIRTRICSVVFFVGFLSFADENGCLLLTEAETPINIPKQKRAFFANILSRKSAKEAEKKTTFGEKLPPQLPVRFRLIFRSKMDTFSSILWRNLSRKLLHSSHAYFVCGFPDPTSKWFIAFGFFESDSKFNIPGARK